LRKVVEKNGCDLVVTTSQAELDDDYSVGLIGGRIFVMGQSAKKIKKAQEMNANPKFKGNQFDE